LIIGGSRLPGMKSKLFVPGSRPELFAKALASAADGLSFDLEDAVTEARKPEARAALRDLLRSPEVTGSAKTIIVRVNGLHTKHFADDLAAVVQPGIDMINLPKPESVADVFEAADALARAERENGVSAPVGILLNVESPRALRLASEMANAHTRVAGLQLGLGDLFEPFGIERRERAAIEQAMFALRMAAAEAGVPAYDSAFANVQDQDGFREEAELARRLGFAGKSCIHPSQIALANAVFRPTDNEIAHALRVVDAARTAEANGVGAYMVDGKMIDPPFVERARAIVASAAKLGLLPA
jgi:citrate lyase subunit beta / citryl-CoA lyase